jgi:tRNA dimethylallyltransferase
VTGKAKSEQQDKPIPRFDFAAFSIEYPRETLYERINQRVDIMFEQGLIAEVQSLLEGGVKEEMQCMQGIGYKEVAEGLRLGASEEEIKELIKKNTRNYAKRQQTFFKRMENHVYLTPECANVEEVKKYL